MPHMVSIQVEWQPEEGVWLATCDALVGLIVQENTLEDCCREAQVAAREMLAQYMDVEKTGLIVDFTIKSDE